MTTLTSSATFAVGDSTTASESTTITVLAAVGSSTGRGRLVHPTFGTYDYAYAPDTWTNIDGDVIVPPLWTSQKTLRGSANTLMVGNIRDVVVEERWNQGLSQKLSHLRTLLNYWMNPPDPSVAYVTWYPNYTSTLGFKVILVNLTVGGNGVTLDFLTKQGFVQGEVVLQMRIAGRV